MLSATKDYATEMSQLRDIEFGERMEPFTRLAAVTVAGVLIFFYSGWISALIWPMCFLFSFGAYSFYVSSRKGFVGHFQVLTATLFLAMMQIAYSWLPIVMLTGPDRGMMFVGGMLICTQLLFLARRNDTLRIFGFSHVLLVAGMSLVIYIGFIPDFDTPLAYTGAALAVIALNFYFAQTLRVSRRIRQSREEAALQAHQAQKMAAIGQLAGGVAHDFNNNLTAIIGSLELMQEMDDPREHAFDVENALVAARQAAKTVKHLMIFARREKPDITRLEVQDIFAELDTLTRRLIPTSVSFQTSMTAPELSVHADRNQLLTALVNLIVNSVDAMPQGGDIFLNADQTRITQPRDLTNGTQLAAGRYVELSVTDTGEGISDDILSKVIDPFFTTKPVGKGTGLGLSMVAGMMQELGGGLSIQSGPETTCVSLYLPVAAN